MVEYVGMGPLREGDPGDLAISTDEGMVDLRASYAVLDVQVDLLQTEVRFSLFGDGHASVLSFSGVTEIYSPAASGGEPYTFFTDQSLMTRLDTLCVTHPDGPPDGTRWFTVETDGGLSLAVRALQATYSTHGGNGAKAQLGRGLVYALVRHWLPDEESPVPTDRADAGGTVHRLDLVDIDLINGIVRLVVAAPTGRRVLRFEDVTDLRTAPADGRDLSARIAEPESSAVITRVGPVRSGDGAVDQWYEAATRGGLEIAVRAGRAGEAILAPSPESESSRDNEPTRLESRHVTRRSADFAAFRDCFDTWARDRLGVLGRQVGDRRLMGGCPPRALWRLRVL